MSFRNVAFAFLLWAFYSFAALSIDFESNEQGYVDAKICATCHQQHFEGFQHVGMSQSFREVQAEWFSEEKLKQLPFYHQNSDRYYDFAVTGKQVFFRRYQLDGDGQKVNEVEVEIDYILGSGNKATSFLFRTANDELYLLPVNWYTNGGFWEMSPGFEQKQHYGLSRKVLRECMFCHNAYPQAEMEKDAFWQRDTFPDTLKNGIDCQRCHGPGKAHVELVYTGTAKLEAIRESIVNPAKLTVEQRDSVCFQCHMLPSVTMEGVRRFDRTDYSFRPGEVLSDYLVHVDIEDEKIPKENRFEINHHGYRLSNSECFKQSQGELTCISCHNPHHKPAASEFRHGVESTCLACHSLTVTEIHDSVDIGEGNCISCHMPQRRTQDVVHAVMTDHKIGVYPDMSSMQEPIVKQEPMLVDMSILDEDIEMSSSEKDIYRLVTILKATPSAQYAEYLKSLLQRSNYPHLRPYIVLAETQLTLKNYEEAKALLIFLKKKFGNNVRIEELLTLVYIATNRADDAEQGFTWLISLDDKNADLFFNYGLLKYRQGHYKEAFKLFEKAWSLKENFANAVLYQGLSMLALGKEKEAISFFLASLQIEPMLDRSYVQLINLYHKQGNRKQAVRYYQLGLKNAVDISLLRHLATETDKQYLATVKTVN